MVDMSNYNKIAPYYDYLAFLVFGHTQRKAVSCLLKDIPSGSRVLIAGGGTGKILEDISRLPNKNFTVVYIEKSIRMLERAKRRKITINNITFIHQDILTFRSDTAFDCIITPFLLDNFSQHEAAHLITMLSCQLDKEGIWIDTDFRHVNNRFQFALTPLIRIMYWFFSWAGEVKAQALPPIDALFETAGYKAMKSETFYKGLIRTVLYAK